MKKLLAVLIVSLLAFGCSQPKTIDTTTDESFKSSVEAVKASLSNERKKELDEALTAIMFSELGNIFDPNSSPEESLTNARKELNGKTADEVIAQGKVIIAERKARQLEQTQKEIIEVKEKIAELEASKAKSEQDKEELKKFEVSRSRFYFQKSDFMTEPIIEMTVVNKTQHAVSRAYFNGVLATPGRSVPWVSEDFNYQISGGLEPGEKATWRLAPNMFSEWGKAPEDRNDMVLTVTTKRIDGADNEPIYNAEFSEFDEKKLEEVGKRLEEMNKNLVELSK